MIQQFQFWEYTQKNWKQSLKRYLYTHVHRNTIHNNEKKEITQVCLTDEWIHKMWYVHSI